MEKKLILTKEEYKQVKSELDNTMFSDEKTPKKYPCIMVVSFAIDIEFGEVNNVGFVYLNDFKV
jgi:hypothetical protein